MAVSKSGEYLGHCFGMDHHVSAIEEIMDVTTRNKLTRKINDNLDFVIGAESSVVFEMYPQNIYKDGGVAFEVVYLATNRRLNHSENLQVSNF